MKDFLGRQAKAGDQIVYPVIRGGKLFLRLAIVGRIYAKARNPVMEIVVDRGVDKKPYRTEYSTPERFVIVGG